MTDKQIKAEATKRERAKAFDSFGDTVRREQCARQYRELATDAEWARRPAYVAGRPRTVLAWDAGRKAKS